MSGEASNATATRVVSILLAVIPFSQIPLDAYTPALPQMVRELSADAATVQHTVTAYMLGMSLALVPMGLWSDAHGRKPTLLAGLALLVATSIGCALVNDIRLLLLLRFVQGIGGCACMVVTYAIAADSFRGARLTSVSGLLGAAWGLAPVLAPAVGGFIVQFSSWRGVFLIIAAGAAIVAAIVLLLLPETLAQEHRTAIDLRRTATTIAAASRNLRFTAFTLVFAMLASAQMVFGVVAPFLYQELLGFSPAGYGLIALLLGGVNLVGELACSGLAGRMAPRRLGLGSFMPYVAGALVLAVSGTLYGASAVTITLGGALILLGCGVLCPMMYGMALGLFERNLGLLGGLISAVCYLIVSATMAVAAFLPETSQAPLGWLYVFLGLVAGLLLAKSLPARAPISPQAEQRPS